MWNSSEYSFVDIKALAGGKIIAGLRGIKYSIKQEKELIHASGKTPRGIAFGRKSYEGEISILQSELEAMILSCKVGGGKDVTDIHGLDIVISYQPTGSLKLTTDTIKNVEFTEMAKDLKWDGKFMEVSLPFICQEIKYGV
jgi:hypothetical protein